MFDFIRLVDKTITDPHITVVNKEFKIHHKKHKKHDRHNKNNKSKKQKEEDNMKIKASSCLCDTPHCKCTHSSYGPGDSCDNNCGCDADCPKNVPCHEGPGVKFCMG